MSPAHAKDHHLDPAELTRYSRHLLLPGVGVDGQERLKAGKVLVIGAGGLGSPAAMYLAAAGVGTIGLVDFDSVEVSNLQRQILHGTAALGTSKLDSAASRLRDINPHVAVELFPTRLTSANALAILRNFDVVLDGSDNFPTRYLVNDGCVLLGKPNVYGSIFQFEGQASVFDASKGPCYRCLFAEPPPAGLVPSCAEGGVLGVLPGIIGSIQALEALKLLLGIGETLVGRLVLLDALTMRIRELTLRKDPGCVVCGTNPTVTGLVDYEAFCGGGAARGAGAEIGAIELQQEQRIGRPNILLDVREHWEWDLAHINDAQLIPLGELAQRINELDRKASIVTICHHGVRSLQALELLHAAGFSQVRSLAGGIDAWAAVVEPGMSRY
ncbi:MAG: molybdopterin-synthase adenylyltransferase MoeB [Gemmatimonadota bacterium]